MIRIEGLTFHGYHGVLESERKLGQKFVVDIELLVDIAAAAGQDDYRQAVCYAEVADTVERIVTGPPCQLIETLADRLSTDILNGFPRVDAVTVQVFKPAAPISHTFRNVSVRVEKKRWREVGFSLGSNLGPRPDILREAVATLRMIDGLHVHAQSSLYESAPWGGLDQPAFLNCCISGETCLTPLELLRRCKETERNLGRVAGLRWGPRAIDIDILYLAGVILKNPVLELPHAQVANRAFVLVPLAEIASDVKITGKSVRQLLSQLPRQDGDVCLWDAAREDR